MRKARKYHSVLFIWWTFCVMGLMLISCAFSLATGTTSTTVSYICGRRCMLAPARDSATNIPLVVIGGMAQTIESWEHHLSALSRNREVLVYECLGQGPLPPHIVNGDDEVEYFRDVSLNVHVNDFASIVMSVFPQLVTKEDSASSNNNNDSIIPPKVDLVGFSFGGRVALAAASTYPQFIRKLHITGVPAHRDAYGRTILASWKDLLSLYQHQQHQSQSLTGYAWSSIFTTHSEDFVGRNEGRIKKWVEFIIKSNTMNGLLALIEQTHTEDEQNMWHPISMAKRIVLYNSNNGAKALSGRLAVGTHDKLATLENVQILSNLLGWGPVGIYDGAGHAVPLEKSKQWRDDLLSFLDGS